MSYLVGANEQAVTKTDHAKIQNNQSKTAITSHYRE